MKEDEEEEKEKIKEALQKCGYQDWQFRLIGRDKPSHSTNRHVRNTTPPKGRVTLPYIRGVSEGI